MKPSAPKKKRRVGRPRKLHFDPLSFHALARIPKRHYEIFRCVKEYEAAHPGCSRDAALAAAGDTFGRSRSAVQRIIKPIETAAPYFEKATEFLQHALSTNAPPYDLSPANAVIERLAAFYSPNEMAELKRLAMPVALKLAEVCEELEALRAVHKRAARRKPAR